MSHEMVTKFIGSMGDRNEARLHGNSDVTQYQKYGIFLQTSIMNVYRNKNFISSLPDLLKLVNSDSHFFCRDLYIYIYIMQF